MKLMFKKKMTLDEFGEFAEKVKNSPCCMNCANCVYIEEGDHICIAGEEPVLVLEEFEPTDMYFCCGGADWEEE